MKTPMEMNEAWTKSAMEQFGFTQEQANQWLAKWSKEHYAGDTTLSYIDWLKHRIADAHENLAVAASDLIQAHKDCRSTTKESTQAMRRLSRMLSLVAPNLPARD